MKRKFLFFMTVSFMLLILFACGSNDSEPASDSTASDETSSEQTSEDGENSRESITLNAVGFLPKDDPLTATLYKWIDSVEEATEGRVTIDWRGGADVIPGEEQIDAVRSGVMDIVFTHVGLYESLAPEALALPLSQLEPWEERESGLYELMVESHEQFNVRYVGRWLTGSSRLWLNEPVASVDELKGLKIRTSPNYIRIFEELGINAIQVSPGDVYTSLQTGVVEGFIYGGWMGPRTNGWTDSSKYVVDHPIFWGQNCSILVNLDKWNEISEEDQKAIEEATAEYERYMVDYYNEESEKEKEELQKIGVEFIQFDTEEDANKFQDTVADVEWQHVEDQVGAEMAEKLREVSERK